jgi:ribose 5-phosphate isomerase RpiB
VIVTARQLEDLYRANGSNGHVVLPYRARLTPLAQDWVKAKRIALGYSDVGKPAGNGVTISSATAPSGEATTADACCSKCAEHSGPCCGSSEFLWWCDGPCGPAKAALGTIDKESSLKPLDIQSTAAHIVPVVRKLAAEVKAGHAAGGILMVQSGAAALVYANRCPSLRAILGTCQDAVEQGIQQVAANVLVIEYPHQSLQQMKNMIARFARASRAPSEEVRRQLEELASCG